MWITTLFLLIYHIAMLLLFITACCIYYQLALVQNIKIVTILRIYYEFEKRLIFVNPPYNILTGQLGVRNSVRSRLNNNKMTLEKWRNIWHTKHDFVFYEITCSNLILVTFIMIFRLHHGILWCFIHWYFSVSSNGLKFRNRYRRLSIIVHNCNSIRLLLILLTIL